MASSEGGAHIDTSSSCSGSSSSIVSSVVLCSSLLDWKTSSRSFPLAFCWSMICSPFSWKLALKVSRVTNLSKLRVSGVPLGSSTLVPREKRCVFPWTKRHSPRFAWPCNKHHRLFLAPFYLGETLNALRVHLYRDTRGTCLQDDGF
jgi:hypothetical protein